MEVEPAAAAAATAVAWSRRHRQLRVAAIQLAYKAASMEGCSSIKNVVNLARQSRRRSKSKSGFTGFWYLSFSQAPLLASCRFKADGGGGGGGGTRGSDGIRHLLAAMVLLASCTLAETVSDTEL
jgi:hypothetical protein